MRALRCGPAHWGLLIFLVLGLGACDPAKRVPKDRHLLTNNNVEVKGDVDKGELANIIKQKPNKRILGMRFHLGVYNSVDTVKMKRGIAEKTVRLESTNARRKAEGKSAKAYHKTWREWLRETVGEPPVILDTNLTARSVAQMRLYMRKEGYFHALVTDTTLLHRPNGKPFRHRKAKVRYTVVPGAPYTVCEYDVVVDDARIRSYIAEESNKSLIKTGMRMDADVLDMERKRITGLLNELGYLYFTRDMLHFDADTTVGLLQADLVLRAELPLKKNSHALAGTREGTVHWLDDVTVDLSGRYRQGLVAPDTLRYEGYSILYRGKKPYIRPKALARHLFLRPTERYKQSNEDNTYRRLTSLRVFDRVDIKYDTTNTVGPDQVDALITLLPTRSQSFSIEGAGTNRGGFLGTSISLGYKHRNVARSLGQLTTSFTLGLEAQQSVSGQEANTDPSGNSVGTGVLFNTVELGPELNYKLPRPILFAAAYGPSSNARTTFTALYNYQRRPDYTRTLAKLSLGQEWYPKPRVLFGVYAELNGIKIPLRSQAFEDYLDEANDPVLTNSYTDHLVFTLPRISRTWNTQGTGNPRNVFFDRTNFELAGFVVRHIQQLASAPMTTDTLGESFYTLLNVRYAEFAKFENDFRYYYTIHDKGSLAFRVAGGIGVPFGNLDVLPFETSFFVGGANGLRAWRARSVGPGSYRQPLDAFDRVGEVRIEANAEYRFKLIGFLEGALFADVGNIWLLEEDPRKPGSGLSNEWLSELAVGTGLGARFNFDFFIIRFDFGLQTKDPSLPRGERWLYEPKDEYEAWRNSEPGGGSYTYKPKVNFNLGIGYPF
jgi:outer membrane protein assembly factor BamA